MDIGSTVMVHLVLCSHKCMQSDLQIRFRVAIAEHDLHVHNYSTQQTDDVSKIGLKESSFVALNSNFAVFACHKRNYHDSQWGAGCMP